MTIHSKQAKMESNITELKEYCPNKYMYCEPCIIAGSLRESEGRTAHILSHSNTVLCVIECLLSRSFKLQILSLNRDYLFCIWGKIESNFSCTHTFLLF